MAENQPVRLAVAVVLFLTVVGSALVWVFFDATTALTTLGCSLLGAGLFAALYGLMALMGRWSERLWR
jgi:apolipoprotein N-acyltransferase